MTRSRDLTRRRWFCVCHFLGIEPGDLSPNDTGLLHDVGQYTRVKTRYRFLIRRHHPDKQSKEPNHDTIQLIKGAWNFVLSNYEPPIGMTGEHPVSFFAREREIGGGGGGGLSPSFG